MIELGMKGAVAGANLLKPLDIHGRPIAMPSLLPGHKVICGYDQGSGERLLVCDTLAEMQKLYDNYYSGAAITINWYQGQDPGFVTVIAPNASLPAVNQHG